MTDFNINIYDDSKGDITDIKLYILELNKRLNDFQISVTCSYSNLDSVKDEIKNCDSDFIILDLIDDESNKPLGKDAIKHNIKKIPTLIYTNKAGTIGFDISEYQSKHPFLKGLRIKSNEGGENLISFLYSYILNEKFGSLCFTIYNDHDFFLKIGLKFLGLNRVNSIVQQINKKYNLEKPMVYPMTSGLSGAMLFNLKYSNVEYILKLSKDIEKLREEHGKAITLYKKFPDRFLNHIDSLEYFSFDKEVLGFLMKRVENSVTLFEYILNVKGIGNIDIKLEDLFLKPQGLKNHYSKNKDGKSDWSSIFDKIDESRYLLINKSYDEVGSLVKKYYTDISVDDFRRLAIVNDYENLNKYKLTNDQYIKDKLLSHGDFHAKNILIQENLYVKIIDTGLINYCHWSLDVSRLIVNLFITGVDQNTVEFFKLKSIKKYINLLEKIMQLETIPMDGQNDNIYNAINWLVNNVTEIYDCFELFEFQLGLMKEFLQVSYRFDTVPPNRRAFSLIAADKLMKEANINVKS